MTVNSCNETAKVKTAFTISAYGRGMFVRLSKLLRIFGAFLVLSVLSLGAPAAAQNFSFQFTTGDFSAVFADGSGRTITVTLEPEDVDCAAFDTSGRATIYARSSVAACDRHIELTFTAIGFDIERVNFSDIDDMDGTAPRDSFAGTVAGTWNSPTIEVFSLSSPPAFADEVARLTSVGAVGTFLANQSGENPVDETASFTLAVPTSSFSIVFDDSEGGRDARNQFNLGIIEAEAPPPGGGPPTSADCIDFESGLGGFQVSNSTFVGVNTLTSNSGNSSMFLHDSASSATSPVFNGVGVTNVTMWVRRGADSFSENPDANEDLVIEALNSSGAWIQLAEFPGSGTQGQIFDLSLPLLPEFQHAGLQIRFRLLSGSGTNFDFWHVDDVCVESPSLPELTVSKVSSLIADPVNGSTNPKAIPGATVEYLITVTNIGDGPASDVIILDNGPADAKLCLLARSGGPIIFGEPGGASGLTYNYGGAGSVTDDLAVSTDDLEFSEDGGIDFGYTPNDDGTGCDVAVTDFRVRPSGTLSAGATITITVRFEIM
ncbi:MAG: hypothetical protein ABJ205_06275 [Erythrobacter sp.]|uniref:hypothetical protein n=1 Tax=Erythrobacter sp. TaxID=1042 RepID=UPI0032669567